MGVYIKDMDKPSECDLCNFEDYGYCRALLSYIDVEEGIDTRCPLVEIADRKTENSSEKPNNLSEKPILTRRCAKCGKLWVACHPKDPRTLCEYCREDKHGRTDNGNGRHDS